MEPVSRDQILRREQGKGKLNFPLFKKHFFSPVDPYSAESVDPTFFFFFFFLSSHLYPMDLIITILPVDTKDLPISPRFTPYIFFIAMQVQYSYNSSTNG